MRLQQNKYEPVSILLVSEKLKYAFDDIDGSTSSMTTLSPALLVGTYNSL